LKTVLFFINHNVLAVLFFTSDSAACNLDYEWPAPEFHGYDSDLNFTQDKIAAEFFRSLFISFLRLLDIFDV